MKIYNLNIDTSAPVNQAVPMQQNDTGLLNLTVTNGGKYIRNLTTKVYDDGVEVPSTEKGFKVDVGAEPKKVKIEAKSAPTVCEYQYFETKTSAGPRAFVLSCFQLQEGVYHQDEFYEVVKKIGDNNGVAQWLFPQNASLVNFNRIAITPWNPDRKIWFYRLIDGEYKYLDENEPIVATGLVNVQRQITAGRMSTVATGSYPAVGYDTDYQMDITIKPSSNAHYDGDYVEPLKEIEVDGVKFVPTTLTVDGVEYKVLAEAQSDEDPVDSTDSELTDGQE